MASTQAAVRDDLRARITAGEFPTGDMLPDWTRSAGAPSGGRHRGGVGNRRTLNLTQVMMKPETSPRFVPDPRGVRPARRAQLPPSST